jgi:hypothetical protein
LLAQIGEFDRDLVADLIMRRSRDANAARFCVALKPGRDIDPVTENVIALDQDVTEVDPDSVPHTPVLRDALVAFGHCRLHRHRAFHRVDHRRKFEQHAIAGGLDDATAMLCHQGIGDGAVFTENAGRAHLVQSHQSRVTGNVSGHYR